MITAGHDLSINFQKSHLIEMIEPLAEILIGQRFSRASQLELLAV
jgi:hypothetical protein